MLCFNSRCNGTDYLCGKCRKFYPSLANSLDQRKREQRRAANQGKSSYGRGSTSGGYGRSSFSYRSGTFDGLPSLSRRRGDGATEIFYQAGTVDLDDEAHGHVVIKNGKMIYRRRPGQSTPDIDEQ